MSVLKALNDPELQEYYEALFVMYGTPGWKKLMEDVGRLVDTGNSLAGIDTAEQLWFRKGEIFQTEWLKNHQAAVEHAYTSLLEEQEGAAAVDAPNGGRAQIVDPDPL